MKNSIKAVIFDMDGVMIDSEPIHSKSFEYVLKRQGIKPIPNSNGLIQTVGITSKDNLLILKEKYKLEAGIESLVEEKRKIYKKLLSENVRAKQGLIGLIKTLRKNKFKLAIASSSGMDHVKLVVLKLGLGKYFNTVISGESLLKGKPDPEIFLKTAKKLNVDPRFCVVLEDAQSGAEAAFRAGMKIIAVPDKYTASHNFSKADKVVKSLGDINIKTLENL